jgi:hypothetical protein
MEADIITALAGDRGRHGTRGKHGDIVEVNHASHANTVNCDAGLYASRLQRQAMAAALFTEAGQTQKIKLGNYTADISISLGFDTEDSATLPLGWARHP